ncbi:histidyl-tRNA synthetase [Saccharothrix saharensis]|uniref:Histidine--tRNA ligase n=1 Tax=Saccharothrix saharensis TaxID=571190 RepID=A0A543JDE0_9PSEU|nr:histidine--tRNA ligase [Saccharothrix saharensis]TQM80822.1 histidyl-tRNA synthetase [Saccharothrix saharensis]
MSDRPAVRPTPVSGFPEWLPHVRLVEPRWLDAIRAAFERYGFCSVETPSAERLDVLLSKGDTSKEVYTLGRVHDGDQDPTGDDSRLGLRFDLTVPLARYTAQHFNDLVFPFKRYQIQRVWRGERPQDGRFREFTQCDIDVINPGEVPIHFDAELPRIVHEVLTSLDLPAWTINVNNRKVLQGFYEGLGISRPLDVVRAVDKIDKIGPDGVARVLADRLDPAQLRSVLRLAGLRGGPAEVRELGVRSPLLDEGLEELDFVLRELSDLPGVVADFSIARGLDYYTGTVYEGKFVDWPEYGAICSGGRYDDLAGSFSRRELPGVGMSIGFSRIFAKVLSAGLLDPGPSSPADVLVVLPKDRRPIATSTARTLRDRGFNVELYHQEDKVAKQLRYASRKGIGFAWFPPFEDGRPHEVKDLAAGTQTTTDPTTWSPGGQRPANRSGTGANG